jgi:hypothetical protein
MTALDPGDAPQPKTPVNKTNMTIPETIDLLISQSP